MGPLARQTSVIKLRGIRPSAMSERHSGRSGVAQHRLICAIDASNADLNAVTLVPKSGGIRISFGCAECGLSCKVRASTRALQALSFRLSVRFTFGFGPRPK